MSFILDHKGERIDAEVTLKDYKAAADQNISLAQYLNQKFEAANPQFGTPFEQICASNGLVLAGANNPFGHKSPFMIDILEGHAAAATNVEKKGAPYGDQARSLFPAFMIQAIEDAMEPDRESDDLAFRALATTTVPIQGDTYMQPVISYNNVGGANTGVNGAKAGRVSQMGAVPTVLFLGTSERSKNVPTYGIGVDMSDKALKGTTLDLFSLTMSRFWKIEKDARVYTYMSNLFAGDLDQNTGAVPAVTTVSLDAACPAGKVTHKAWLKFLARYRRYRKITHVICDLDTYLKIESREGRPGSNNYDPTLMRIDPQLNPGNPTFGGDVKWIIVDAAADGGPVPADTVWALDATQAFYFVKNTEAEYSATEEFVLRKSKSMVWHWSEEAVRSWGDSELRAFDVLTISP